MDEPTPSFIPKAFLENRERLARLAVRRLNPQLLKELLPYYESLVDDAQMPDTDRSAVYDILSKCALRCGKWQAKGGI